ncbi:MAG: polyprenyl synthetase family protein [Prolixibacteraceae bacterium]|nr:polyprenyl synthetase family protein [Prolixibacteraceae bacterium]MBN2773015.1 polyprenyl synthetase family protein [Prolixibacteraceae bacterium]
MLTLSEIQQIISSEVEKESEKLAKTQPKNLYLPVIYILRLKGKKLRPSLVLLSYNLFSEEIEKAIPAALAVEVFHNFTLLHDDIMDKAEIRRNKATVHEKFGENSAILSGDVMAFVSFRYLLKSTTVRIKELLDLFSTTAIEVCEGQQFDMDFETRFDVSEEEYLNMIRLKTAVLLACSLKLGAIIAGAGNNNANDLYKFGINLGMAFQLQDDLLDTYGDEDKFGKKIGGDIVSNKKTFLLIKALELADPDKRNKLQEWIKKADFNPLEKINFIKSVYNDLQLEGLIKRKIVAYYRKAEESLNSVAVEKNRKKQLFHLMETMINRDY